MSNFLKAMAYNFLGQSPRWYKKAIILFLILNPILFYINPFMAGWVLVVEFIFTLAMALKCYPLQPGGLLAIEAVILGMTSSHHVQTEVLANFEVILLLVFMVAGIYFMKDLLLYSFTKLVVSMHNKIFLSLTFCGVSAFLSAFLDALTVIAVIIAVAVGFYSVYHKVISSNSGNTGNDVSNDSDVTENQRVDLDEFRAFLRSLVMHAGIGSALGGVCTLVGEPQNLIIAEQAGWHFSEFLLRMAPVTMPVLICGFITCILLEKYHLFGYGAKLPDSIRNILTDFNQEKTANMTDQDKAKLIVQGVLGIWLIVGLAMHLAAVGLIGLSVIILATAFTGITEEHALGKAFEEALPFTALLVVFFTIVAVIIDQHLFKPIIEWVLLSEGHTQLMLFYIANGFLSMVSDNVFVGTVYINEVKTAFEQGLISSEQFNLLAVAINTGTNLPSVATPNGQAAFLFLLTSALAPLLRLSYGTMVWMALPYTVVLSLVGLLSVIYNLTPMTDLMIHSGLLQPHM
jgi:NhaB family Na+:H+ antiporter